MSGIQVNSTNYFQHLEIVKLLEMKSLPTIFVLVIFLTVLLAHSGYGQFHWGSNARPELAKLRALVLQQLRTPGSFYFVEKVII